MPSNYFSPDKKLRLNHPTYSFFHLGAKLGSWLTPRPSCFTPENDLIPLYRRMGRPQVWADTENLAPTRIRSPDRPARSDSLYRLSYPGHTTTKTTTANENVNMITHNSFSISRRQDSLPWKRTRYVPWQYRVETTQPHGKTTQNTCFLSNEQVCNY